MKLKGKIISFNAAEIVEAEMLSDVFADLEGSSLSVDRLRNAGLPVAAPLIGKMIREGRINYMVGSQSKRAFMELVRGLDLKVFEEEASKMFAKGKSDNNIMQMLEAIEKLLILKQINPGSRKIEKKLKDWVGSDLKHFSRKYPNGKEYDEILEQIKKADQEGRLWKMFEILDEVDFLYWIVERARETFCTNNKDIDGYELEEFLIEKLIGTEYMGNFLKSVAARVNGDGRGSASAFKSLMYAANIDRLIDFAKEENNPDSLGVLILIADFPNALAKLVKEGDSALFLDLLVREMAGEDFGSEKNNGGGVRRLIEMLGREQVINAARNNLEYRRLENLKNLLAGIENKESFEILMQAAQNQDRKEEKSRMDSWYEMDNLLIEAGKAGCLERFVEIAEEKECLEELLVIEDPSILISPADRSGNLLNLLEVADQEDRLGALIRGIKREADMRLITELCRAERGNPVLVRAMAYVKIF